MTEGVTLGRVQVYTHYSKCEAYERKHQTELQEWRMVARQRLLLEYAGLPFEGDDLPGYIARYGRSLDTGKGLTLCEAFLGRCEPSSIPETGFTLEGAPGTGKTTTIMALARSLALKGVRMRFEVAPDLYNRMLAEMKADRFEDAMDALKQAKVLIVDDLGREKPSPWWVDQVLFPIVDHRYRNKRPTVTTSNYGWRELQAIYANARSERGETAHSAVTLIDRLQHQSAAVKWGGDSSHRHAAWDFLG